MIETPEKLENRKNSEWIKEKKIEDFSYFSLKLLKGYWRFAPTVMELRKIGS